MFLTSLPIPAYVAESMLKTENSCRISKNQLRNARARSKERQLKGIEHSLASLLQMPLRARLLR